MNTIRVDRSPSPGDLSKAGQAAETSAPGSVRPDGGQPNLTISTETQRLNAQTATTRPELPQPVGRGAVADTSLTKDLPGIIRTSGFDAQMVFILAHKASQEMRAAARQDRSAARAAEQSEMLLAANKIRTAAWVNLSVSVVSNVAQTASSATSLIGAMGSLNKQLGVGKQMQPQMEALKGKQVELNALDGLQKKDNVINTQAKMDALGKDIKSLEAQKKDLTGRLETANTDTTQRDLRDNIGQIDKDIAARNEQMADLSKSKAATLGSIGKKETDLKAALDAKKENETEIGSLKDQIKQSEGDLADINKKLGNENLNSEDRGNLTEAKKTLTDKIAETKKTLSERESALLKNEEDIAKLRSQISDLRGDDITRQGGLAAIAKRREDLAASIKSLNTEIGRAYDIATAKGNVAEKAWSSFGGGLDAGIGSIGQVGQLIAKNIEADQQRHQIEASKHGQQRDMAKEFADTCQKFADKVLEVMQSIERSNAETVRTIIRI